MRRGRGGGGGGLAGWLRGAAKREREEKERYPGSSSSGESLLERFAVHVEMTRGPGERGEGGGRDLDENHSPSLSHFFDG